MASRKWYLFLLAITRNMLLHNEVKAAVIEFTEILEGVGAEKLLRESNKTGKGLFLLSQDMDSLRLSLLKSNFCLGNSEILDIYAVDHLQWRWWVYNMLLGYEKIDVNTIGTHHDCRLGKWYNSTGMKLFNNNQVFIDIEKIHADLHVFAKEAAVAYEKNDMQTAEEMLTNRIKASGRGDSPPRLFIIYSDCL